MGTSARKAALPSPEVQARDAARDRELNELQAQIARTQPKVALLHRAREANLSLHPDQSLKGLLGAADSEDELGKLSGRAAFLPKVRPPHF